VARHDRLVAPAMKQLQQRSLIGAQLLSAAGG
jgi:hypothetical protein